MSLSVFTVNIATPIPRLGVLISRVITSAQNQKANMEEGKNHSCAKFLIFMVATALVSKSYPRIRK